MKYVLSATTITSCVLALGCGGTDNNAGVSASGGESGGTTAATSAETTGPGASDTHASASASASASVGETGSSDGADGNDSGPLPVKLDVLGIPDAAMSPCDSGKGGGGGIDPDFSYIWVANSTEGTVSKINTVSLEEEGRYRTRIDPNGSPSRTSVSLNGDVAVANRMGGVVKISARLEGCPDSSNTSSGSADVKDFPDGCVVWFTPFNYTSQRPVAWAPGVWSDITCRYEDEMLWTSGAQGEAVEVLLLNGEDGAVEETIPIVGTPANFYGIYGGASDADGNFWGSQLGIGNLVRVDRNSFAFETHPMPQSGYGMTVDTQGRPWICNSGVARFDPDDGTWSTNAAVGGGGGCMVDADGHLWVGGYGGGGGGELISIDTETLAIAQTIPIPNYVHGVSIDFYGYVWGVTLQQPWAYRVDPSDGTFETFTGLTGPYTYSDMTGWALSNVVGGQPSG